MQKIDSGEVYYLDHMQKIDSVLDSLRMSLLMLRWYKILIKIERLSIFLAFSSLAFSSLAFSTPAFWCRVF